jgi:flagellum-specific peptidoglycan hydrolase FlgJ
MKLKVLMIIAVTCFMASCSSRKRVVKTAPAEEQVVKKERRVADAPNKKVVSGKKVKTYSDPKLAYINKYSDIAMNEMRQYKIPASITLAQGILESRSGQSTLTKKSNNHFGIKCHKGWTGRKTYYDDDEKGECFRVYKYPEKSFKDHSLFLAERTRYQDLFKLKITDYKGWAKGLKKAGYATDRTYPQKLIKIVEDYDLYKYDDRVIGKRTKRVKKTTVKSYEVVKGDTLYSISRKYGLTVDQIKAINGLVGNEIAIGQKIIVKN